MRLEITPYVQAGPVRFGAEREEVRRLIGGPVEEFRKSPDSGLPVDDFIGTGIHVYYGPAGTCQAVEMALPAEPILHGQMLLALGFADLRMWLSQMDRDLHVDDDGLTSLALGIGIFAPYSVQAPHEPAEAVIAFERDYYA